MQLLGDPQPLLGERRVPALWRSSFGSLLGLAHPGVERRRGGSQGDADRPRDGEQGDVAEHADRVETG